MQRDKNTEKLLQVYQALSAERPGKVISGVHTPEGAAELAEQTGHWPGLMGIEYCHTYGTQPADSAVQAIPWQEWNPPLIEHGQRGGFVRMLTHFPNPMRSDYCGLRDTDADLKAILSPGTEAHKRWRALLDQVAAGLQDLAINGVSVLYGPLHEMNCSGFWWGLDHPQNDADQYKALWRDLVTYIAGHHDCRNVLWLWAPLGMTPVVLEAYPGDDVVDLIGLDVYDTSLKPFLDSYHTITTLDKPFVLSEYGPGRWDMTEPAVPPYDCRQLLSDIENYWPVVTSFMFWGGCFLPTRQNHAKGMMDAPPLIDRDTFKRMWLDING